MQNLKGTFICIEGTDGSGKGTQAENLIKRLREDGYDVLHKQFPQYGKTLFGIEVGKFLNGDYGMLHPRVASILYAGDRFQAVKDIQSHLEQGGVVICDRYAASNIAYQCSRVPEDERVALREWLYELEFGVFDIPRPDLTIFLDVPVDVSMQLVMLKSKREYTEQKEDIFEQQRGLIEAAHCQYSWMAEHLNGWERVNCMQHPTIHTLDTLKSPEVIADNVVAVVRNYSLRH